MQNKHSASPLLMSSPESSFLISMSISHSLDHSGMPTLPFFEDLLIFVPKSLLLPVSLTAIRFSSPDIPATASCKQTLLRSLHNSLSIGLLDLWEKNILMLDEEWVGRLLDS